MKAWCRYCADSLEAEKWIDVDAWIDFHEIACCEADALYYFITNQEQDAT